MPLTASPSATPAPTAAPAAPVFRDNTTLLRRFVEAYWLRPENALWMTLRSLTLRHVPLARPSIDVSCGDGIFSFLHLGGVLDPAFDVFCSVAGVDTRRRVSNDMFDHFETDYLPPVWSVPAARIDVGEDCKASMLAKAGKLPLYERLVEHDNNTPLPFEDESFGTIYCNSAYWVTKIDLFLRELRRATHLDGRIVLQVKLDSMKAHTLESHRAVLGDRFLQIIGSRFEHWPTLTDRRTWERRFSAAGLRVTSATPFITAAHSRLWDVGLRPIAPLLIRMANALTPASRAAVKRDWVELMLDLLTPLCAPDLSFVAGDQEPAEIQYVLTRTG